MRAVGLALLCAVSSAAQTADPAYPVLEKAYERAKARDYDAAIAGFRRAAELSPRRTDIRKNLAYTLLRVGETEAARDQFAEAMRLDPADHHVALEFAFLANETGQQRVARLVFDRVRASATDPVQRATAEQAFQNVDRPLAEGIARWQQALESGAQNFSAHEELARLAEQRNDWTLAATHYEAAWRLRPAERRLLLDLGRAWKETGRAEQSVAAFLAASRGAEARTAEAARSLLPERYPYVYEFRAAIALDPPNIELRRELAYLLLEMGEKQQAETEFKQITKDAPDDMMSAAQLAFLMMKRGEVEAAKPLLDKVLATGGVDEELADRVRSALQLPKALRRREEEPKQRDAAAEARDLAEKSYKAGYMKDALKYLTIVHETDPLDYGVMLKLGFTSNVLKQDRQAMDWFKLARYSPDPSIAAEAQRAYRNLQPQFQRFRTTTWAMPFFSSRWNNAFTYGQVKTEIKSPLPVRPYLSVRFVGDARGSTNQPFSQYLSETAFILGGGVATPVHKGLMAWGEAGVAVSYLRRTDQPSRARPDYRGGVSYTRARGHLLGAETPGWFFENHEDGVFVSRFNNTLLFYTQNKTGYTRGNVQFYCNLNLTTDAKRQYWANFAEAGPGLRFRWAKLPPAMAISLDFMRGVYTINKSNPRRPNYYDVRAGVWYAFTR
jgi:Flp pilus assembly protein TadD